MEFKKGDKTKTRMLHQLIELAKAGKKFRARFGDDRDWRNNDYFKGGDWSAEGITTPWQYEEVREPRVVGFEAIPSKETNQYAKIWAKELLPLKGVKCRVVVTEVIDE